MTRSSLVHTLALIATAALVACHGTDFPPPRDLHDLVVRDSTYYAPGASEPYTGPVYRNFLDDAARHQIEGLLVDGTWHGELRVYHRSGRIRYMGAFDHGQRCGPWTENRFDRAPEGILDELRTEIEALGMYPPCPEDR